MFSVFYSADETLLKLLLHFKMITNNLNELLKLW